MVLGKVIGTLVASRKEPTLEGLKLLVVRACDVDGNPSGGIAIAVDAVLPLGRAGNGQPNNK